MFTLARLYSCGEPPQTVSTDRRVARADFSGAGPAGAAIHTVLVAGLLVAAATVTVAQDRTTRSPASIITSDRPGLGDGAWVLAPGVWQAELGATFRDVGPDRLGEGSALVRAGLSDLELRLYLPSPLVSVEPDGTEVGDLGLGFKLPLATSEDWRWSLVGGAFFPTGTDAVRADDPSGFATVVGETAVTESLALTINAGASVPVGSAEDTTLSLIPTLSRPLTGKMSAYAGYAGFYSDSGDEHWLEAGVAIGENADFQWDLNSAYDFENDVWFVGVGVSMRWR